MSNTVLENVRLQLKNDTAARWAQYNPVLAKGELGLEVDTAKFKFGDGVTTWKELIYAGTIVKAGTANGHITIDGTDIPVYTLPVAADNIGGVKSQASGTGKVVVATDGTMTVGNVPSADALSTARTISLAGDASGSVAFNGGSDASIAVALVTTGVNSGTYCKVTVDTKGRITAGADLTANDIPVLTLSKITDVGAAAAKDVGSAAGNVPIIGTDGKLDSSIMPAISISEPYVVTSEAEMLALTAQTGDLAIRSDTSQTYMLKADKANTLDNWVLLQTPTGSVLSVNGKTGAISLTTSDLLEGNNLYYTESRATANFNTNFAGKNSADLKDGSHIVHDTDTVVIDCGNAE